THDQPPYPTRRSSYLSQSKRARQPGEGEGREQEVDPEMGAERPHGGRHEKQQRIGIQGQRDALLFFVASPMRALSAHFWIHYLLDRKSTRLNSSHDQI